MTTIQAGSYELSQENGTVGGPYTITITSFPAAALETAVPLEQSSDSPPAPFKKPYTLQMELPTKDAQQDFDVPASHQ